MAEDKDNLKNGAKQPNKDEMDEKEIDANLMGTFPASDPPSWTLGTNHHEGSREKQSVHQTTEESTEDKSSE
ncbi:MAG: hypothetical protein WCB68_16095 [Pyrinomonadaceae bacterium]